MTEIREKSNSFKRFSLLLLGLVWILNGSLHLYNYQDQTHLILGVIFTLLGIAYFFMHFYYRNTGYIAWNNSEILISRWQRKKSEKFLFDDIVNITVTNSHFILKSKYSKTLSWELKSYTKEDIFLLKTTFSAVELQNLKQC